MKDEIKEILDKLKDGTIKVNLSLDGIRQLEDYITNLQEENERLYTRIKTIKRRRKAQTAKMRKYREEITNKQNSIVDYKSRNEKAIEYIEHENFKRTLLGFSENKYLKNIQKGLLNILQGSDNNGKDKF